MVAAGMDDVLVANEVVDPRKIARLVALAGRARIGVVVDDPEPVAALSREAVRAGAIVDVLIDVDILLHRCGVASAPEAARLADAVDRAPGLRLRGIMGYEGRIRRSDGDREGQDRAGLRHAGGGPGGPRSTRGSRSRSCRRRGRRRSRRRSPTR